MLVSSMVGFLCAAGATVLMCVQGQLGAFVDFIKERKTVALEDLAAEFGLRVQVGYVKLRE